MRRLIQFSAVHSKIAWFTINFQAYLKVFDFPFLYCLAFQVHGIRWLSVNLALHFYLAQLWEIVYRKSCHKRSYMASEKPVTSKFNDCLSFHLSCLYFLVNFGFLSSF